MIALMRKSEIEFLKIMSIINAIISVGNTISAAVSGSDSTSNDSLRKTLDSLKEMLLPHFAEDTKRKAEKYKAMMQEEATRGPLKIKVVGKGNSQIRR